MRELAPQDELLLPHDRDAILWVPAQQWNCPRCDPKGTAPVPTATVVWDPGQGERTTVAWMGKDTEGPDGRCSSCGQKYALARAGEHVPTIAEQLKRREAKGGS